MKLRADEARFGGIVIETLPLLVRLVSLDKLPEAIGYLLRDWIYKFTPIWLADLQFK
ncbi:hypothetical protein [Nostoc sp.]|uniref:hypothetical protein n=1 Tax=Nostoc sp. TaxID=1180 RepID=UPI002FF47429